MGVRLIHTGKVVLLVSLVWLSITLLLLVQIDDKFSQQLSNYKHHPDRVLSRLLGAFQMTQKLANRQKVMDKIIFLMETGINKTEDILKLTNKEIHSIYEANLQIMENEHNYDIGYDRLAYRKLQELDNRLKRIIGENDILTDRVEENNAFDKKVTISILKFNYIKKAKCQRQWF